ncbi:MAG: DUF899 family protein [Gammaproteobacteria bacterium]
MVYHFLYGKQNTSPCPMCTLLIDGCNGVAHHLAQNLDFAIVAATDLAALRAHARTRAWDNLRLLSCGGNTFKYDLGSEDREGNQDSTVSVSPGKAMAPFATSTPPTRSWRITSRNAAWI